MTDHIATSLHRHISAPESDPSDILDITDTLDHGVHLANLPIVVDKHDIVATYRCDFARRSELPFQHHQIAIDPDIPTRSKCPSWVAVKKLRDEVVDGIEAGDQLFGVVEGDFRIVSHSHLGKTFIHVAFAEDAQKVLFGELLGMLSRDGCHTVADVRKSRCTDLLLDGLTTRTVYEGDTRELIWQYNALGFISHGLIDVSYYWPGRSQHAGCSQQLDKRGHRIETTKTNFQHYELNVPCCTQ